MRARFQALWRGESGQDLIEYAMLVGLIALTSTVLFPSLGTHVRSVYGRAASALQKSTEDQPMMVRAGAGAVVVTERPSSDDHEQSAADSRR